MLTEAPLIATLPTRMARHYGSAFGLQIVALPMELVVPDIALVWTAYVDNDPASKWLRDQITNILGSM